MKYIIKLVESFVLIYKEEYLVYYKCGVDNFTAVNICE